MISILEKNKCLDNEYTGLVLVPEGLAGSPIGPEKSQVVQLEEHAYENMIG